MSLIEVDLNKIIIDEKRQDQVIVLKERGGTRQFPIMIGLVEASSIKMKLSNLELPRPMTHDLIISILEGLEATPKKLVIDKIVDHTFHAKLVVETASGVTKEIDSRPSDGVALAVRAQIPIFVEEEVLKSTEIPKF
ncbi:MAG: bifunctional nuclease family protein [Candidatus Omnitrophica bacterium]|nr:bifunctional nuclease family protein [Candidatus Omnitrophota bacterium]